MNGLWSAVLFAVCLSLFVYFFVDLLIGSGAAQTQKIEKRLKNFRPEAAPIASIALNVQFSSIARFNEILKRKKFFHQLNSLLDLTGWNMPVSIFLFASLLLGGFFYFFIFALTGAFAVSLAVSLVVSVGPLFFLSFLRKQRMEKFAIHFPQALMMMRNALNAGQGIQAAFKVVAAEAPKPICTEFQRIIHEIDLGAKFEEAVKAIYRRIPIVDLRIFVLGLFIQQEAGGNLGDLLTHIEESIRTRLALARELKALTAQGKMAGIVLIFLPVVVGGIMFFINPQFFSPLLQEDGRKLLYIAGGLEIAGAVVIHKMTSVSISS